MAGLLKMREKREQRDELLSAYLDGQLGAGERARLEEQLAADPALRAELERLRRTVALVRSLPAVSAPRNFVLPQAMAAHPRPARAPRPHHTWVAPLLTAATAIVSLACVAVLAGDLLMFSTGRLAFAPAAAPMEAPQVATAPTQVSEQVQVEAVEVEKEVSVTAALQAAPAATVEVEGYVMEPPAGGKATAPPSAEALVGATSAPAPTPTPPPPGERADTLAPTPRQPTAAEATPAPATPVEATPVPAALATAVPESDVSARESTPEEAAEPVAQAPPPAVGEEAPRAVEGEQGVPEGERAGRGIVTPCRILEAILGLAALGLALATVRAWRARRH